MEKDDDWYGAGNEYTTEFRQLDVRTGRWMSMDPMMAVVPDRSPYEFVFNNPVALVDPDGLLPFGKGGGNKTTVKSKHGHANRGRAKSPKGSSGGGDNSSGGGASGGIDLGEIITMDEVVLVATAGIRTAMTINQYIQENRYAQDMMTFFAGFGDQFGSNLSPIGEVPGVLRPQNNAMYNFGRSMGNKASYVWGLGEIVYGAVLTGGGGAATLHTLGTSLTVSVAGISTIGHGAWVLSNAYRNGDEIDRMNNNMHSGSSNSGGGFQKMGKQKRSNAERMPDDVAKKLKIKDRKNFGKYIEKMKKSEGRGGKDNYTWDELIEIGKDFLESGGH